jgi:Ribosome associated membrane protein RAMP4
LTQLSAHMSHVVPNGPQPAPRAIANKTKKFDKNITKRGNVPIGKAAERQDEFPVSKTLIAFFLIVVVGSSVVQILNMFTTAKPPPL